MSRDARAPSRGALARVGPPGRPHRKRRVTGRAPGGGPALRRGLRVPHLGGLRVGPPAEQGQLGPRQARIDAQLAQASRHTLLRVLRRR